MHKPELLSQLETHSRLSIHGKIIQNIDIQDHKYVSQQLK